MVVLEVAEIREERSRPVEGPPYRQNHRLEAKLSYPEIGSWAAHPRGPRRSGQGPVSNHLIVDEGQDLHPAHWQLLRAAVTWRG